MESVGIGCCPPLLTNPIVFRGRIWITRICMVRLSFYLLLRLCLLSTRLFVAIMIRTTMSIVWIYGAQSRLPPTVSKGDQYNLSALYVVVHLKRRAVCAK